MVAKEIIAPAIRTAGMIPIVKVGENMSVIDVLPRLLDSPERVVGVVEEPFSDIGGKDKLLGVIDSESMLEGLGRMIAPRDDSSVIRIECAPVEYSASSIARAVEDSDTHLVDLLSVPDKDGHLSVTLRVRSLDPSAAIQSLERYGYRVVESSASSYRDYEIAASRLLELQTILNI